MELVCDSEVESGMFLMVLAACFFSWVIMASSRLLLSSLDEIDGIEGF